jgi:hypothetical protein
MANRKAKRVGAVPAEKIQILKEKKLLTASKCNQVIPKIHFDLKNRITRISNEVDAKKMLEN